MKYFVCSDIHGSASACEKLIAAFEREKCDFFVILGDVLYHGPRNDLPSDYEPKKVIALLNPMADKIICCRGNCDGEVDQMVLKFPVLSDYNLIVDGGVKIFATHGHVYSPLNEDGTETAVPGAKVPPIETGVILYGHTHVSKNYRLTARGDSSATSDPRGDSTATGILVINPGSASIPKDSTGYSYAIIDVKDGKVSAALGVL